MYKTAIIDDDEISLAILGHALGNYQDVITLSGMAQTPEDGKQLVLTQQPDLLFLDVELPGMSGFDLLGVLGESVTWQMHTVIFSSHDHHAVRAFRQPVFDYLKKPCSRDVLGQIMHRFVEEKTRYHHPALPPVREKFLVETPTGARIVSVAQVAYFEYVEERRAWQVVLADGSRLCLRRSHTAETIEELHPRFKRISRKHIINANHLAEIRNGCCILGGKSTATDELVVSRNYLGTLHECFHCM